jgi:DNA-binding response OmpR family regulator
MPFLDTLPYRAVMGVPVETMSVLVIEDNPDSRESLCTLLNLWGYKTHTAADGQEGVKLANRFRPSVVVSDIGLPFLNGYEVARQLRKSLGDEVFLVALTAYGQTEDCVLAQEAGYDVHLTKPADPEELHSLLETIEGR